MEGIPENVSLLDHIKNSNIEAVESLLKGEAAKPEIKPEFLVCAFQTGCLEIIEILLQNGGDANTKAGGELLIFHAIESENPVIVALLLKHGAILGMEQNRILLHAIKSGNLKLFELLIEKMVETGRSLERIMLYSVRKSHLKELGILLKHNKNYVQRNSELLCTAIERDLQEVTMFLLENGANPNAEYWDSSRRRSNSSESSSHAESFRSILEISEVDIANALELLKNSLFLDDVLIDFEDKVPENFIKEEGKMPLHFAVELNRKKAMTLLLEHGAEVNVRSVMNVTPLMIAADKGFLDVAAILLEYGAVVDVFDDFGNTALHTAVKKGHAKVFHLLLCYVYDDFQSLCRAGIYGASLCASTMDLLKPCNLDKGGREFLAVVLCHQTRMKALGFDFPENSAINRLISLNHGDTITDYRSKCTMHIKQLQSITICGVPLLEILKKNENQLVELLRNGTFSQILRTQKARERLAPNIYLSVIYTQLRKGERRKHLLDQGLSVNNLLLFNFVSLPDIVVDKILKNLNNKDIRAFVSACKLCSE